MTKQLKQYSINFKVVIHDKATTYPEVKPIDMTVTENLPSNVDPQKYLRRRIAEELARQFSQLSAPIENMTPEVAADQDPLSEPEMPF